MALTNEEKDCLREGVKREIARGRSIQAIVAKFEYWGFKKSTIKRYYKTFNKAGE